MTDLTTTFDYTQLAGDKQARLQALAHQGRYHLRRTKEEIIAFGEVLLEAKTLLPHGHFRSWASAEFGIPDSTLTYAMHKAKGGDIEIENVNVNILPKRAESKDAQHEVEELEPLARVYFMEILAIGQGLSKVKMRFMQQGYMHLWEDWCSKGAKMPTATAGLFITIYETYMMHPDTSPLHLLPSVVTPMMIVIGYLLSKQTEEEIEAFCYYADWLHGIALLQDGRPIDIPPGNRQEALEEALEGLQMAKAKAGAGCFS
jgi:hypothetical protein